MPRVVWVILHDLLLLLAHLAPSTKLSATEDAELMRNCGALTTDGSSWEGM